MTWSITAGVLALGSAGALGTSGTIAFKGGTLQYSSANNIDYSSRFSTAATQSFRIDTNGQDVTFATGLVSSGGELVKFGLGTLTLQQASSFSEGAIIAGGILQLNNLNSAGPGSILLSRNDTKLLFNIAGTAPSIFENAIAVADGASGTVAAASGTSVYLSGPCRSVREREQGSASGPPRTPEPSACRTPR